MFEARSKNEELTEVYPPEVRDAGHQSATFDHDKRPHWRYAHAANGNQYLEADPIGVESSNPGLYETTFLYDEFNRRTSRIIPGGNTETWTYDARGRMAKHTDHKGQTTQYIYDETQQTGGRLLEERRFTAAVDPTPDERTTCHYDALGRRDEVKEFKLVDDVDTEIRSTTYEYDPINGGVSQVASPEGTINYDYDEATGR